MSPRTTIQNEVKRRESRQKIMDAAFQLIARNGYEATSIAEIARSAGISKGLLYNYFESKEDLLEQLVTDAMSASDKMISSVLDEDPIQTLRNIIGVVFHELRTRTEHYKLMTDLTLKIDRFQFVHDMASRKMREYASFIKDLLTQMGIPNPEGEAHLLGALFDGIAIQYLLVRDDYPLDEMEQFLIKKYCDKNI